MDPLSIAASIIAIVGGISATSKTIKTIKGLPKAFDEVQNDFPLALSILRGAQNSLLDGQEITEDEKDAVLAVLQPCHDKAKELKRVFDEVRAECEKDKDAKDWAKLRTAYHKALRGVKASRVEHLMMDILEGLKKLAFSQVFKSATQHDIQTLEKAIRDLSKVEPSLPDSEFGTDGQIHASQHNAPGAMAQQNNVQGGINTINSGKYVATGTGHTFHYGKDS
jgi:hypothetical protein